MTTKSFDPVQEYLRERGCPSHVVRMGLKGLVATWEKVVAELVFDGYRFGLVDFVNDLDRREILQGALDRLGGVVPADMKARVAGADKRFLDATWAASRCLLDDEAAVERSVTRATHFWYYRVPRRHRAQLAKDLQRAGITPESDSNP
jgi:hypothetical protein